MATKQATKQASKRKPAKTLKRLFAKRAIADIDAMIKTQKKLDLELKKIERHIKKLIGHQYFA